jgi:TonB-linked SusC/RagA family outer membrane protein
MKIMISTIRQLLVAGLFLLLSFSVLAQEKSVSGRITDVESGEGLPGVTILEVGTTNGTITDIDGSYKLQVSGDAAISVSFIGYQTATKTVGNQSTINVALEIDVTALDEVVIVDYGYGKVDKKDFTGSVASISGREMSKIPVASTAQALSGRLPGVNILTTDGSPDAEVVIRVRGGGSVTQDNSPLFVVDGFIVGSIRDIPPSDIESINVLKDAAATAIYGAQASNGVIVITTKTPKAGKMKVSYNGFYQAKFLPQDRAYDVMSPYEFALANYEYFALRGETALEGFTRYYGTYEDLELYKSKPGRDWQDELLGDVQASQYHNLSMNGGNENTRFMLSLTNNKDQGILPNNGYIRNVVNFKLDQSISDKIEFNALLRITNTVLDGAGTSGASQLRIKDLIQTRPTNGIAENLEVDLANATGDDDFQNYLLSRSNPTDLIEQDWRKRTDNNYVYGLGLSWDIISGLQFQTKFTGETTYRETLRYYGPLTGESYNNGDNLPLGYKDDREGYTYRTLNTLQYDFPFIGGETHDLKLLVGQEAYTTGGKSQYVKNKGFRYTITPEEMFANLQLGTVALNNETSEFTPSNRFSLFGRLDYQLNGKYLATATFRSDASSKFSRENRLGIFPAFALGWKISEEAFLSGLSFLDELKLRASYGETGNDRIETNAFSFLFETSNNRGPGFGNSYNNYYTPASSVMYNPDLIWETTINRNVGIDFSFLKAKVVGSVDYYYNSTQDLLLQSAVPPTSGFSTQWDNVGSTSNRGIDFGVTAYIVDNKDFSLSINANIGVNKNRIDALDGTDSRFFHSNWASTDLVGYDDYYFQVGGSIGDIYGYVTDGYYSEDDFNSYDPVTREYILKEGLASTSDRTGSSSDRPGFLKLKDINGDSIINDNDRVILGNGLPDAQGGFGVSTTFRGFDLQVFFNWQFGNEVYNTNKIDFNRLVRNHTISNMLSTMNIDNRYTYLDVDGSLTGTAGGIVTDLDQLREMNEGKEMWSHYSTVKPVVHSWAIEDGSFLRLNQLTLGYTLPSQLTRKAGISNLRVYATGNNLHVWTKYSGYDPEVSTSRSSSYQAWMRGMDYNSFPRSRSYTVGINVTF